MWMISSTKLTLPSLHPSQVILFKFKMPTLDSYDGKQDPCDHITMFKTTMHLQGILDEIICRAFPTTLKGPTKVWERF